MRRIYQLAERCHLSAADLLGLAREVAMDQDLRQVEDLDAFRVACLHGVLLLLADCPEESLLNAA